VKAWLKKNPCASQRRGDSPTEELKRAICESLIGLAKKFGAGRLSAGEFFERCTTIIQICEGLISRNRLR
jgi:hypothetical protein